MTLPLTIPIGKSDKILLDVIETEYQICLKTPNTRHNPPSLHPLDNKMSLYTTSKIIFLYLLWIAPLLLAAILPRNLFPAIPTLQAFVVLFVWRYWRLIVGFISIQLSNSSVRILGNPTITPNRVSVIIPTVKPWGPDFEETVRSALKNGCREIIVVTVGHDALRKARPFCNRHTKVRLVIASEANKRVQVVRGLREVDRELTDVVIFADDHVEWPLNFVPSVLAAFEDEQVGGVGTQKRVIRQHTRFLSVSDIINFLGCLYLQRHNFDLTATNGVDGSVFVISGRTAAYRSSIVCDRKFLDGFLSETWWWGSVSRLPEDDNFLTRWLVNHNWKIRFITGPSATIVTTIGIEGGWPRWNTQVLRWTRTTWRSNLTSLFAETRAVWRSQPWGVYSIYLTSFFNFALFVDPALIWLAHNTAVEFGKSSKIGTYPTIGFILVSKVVKTLPHYRRNPEDIIYLPVAIGFSYLHSLIKLYCLLTAHNTSWGERPGLAAAQAAATAPAVAFPAAREPSP
jgi:Glycosyltransferase like family 2